MEKGRENFSGNLGFILTAIGGAVGMGNLWRFPNYVGRNGGFYFLLFYILFAALFGMPLILAETSIGRSGRLDCCKSFSVIAQREGSKHPRLWWFIGLITFAAGIGCLFYYNVVGGWVIQYLVKSFTTPPGSMDLELFNATTSSVISPLVFTIICIVALNLIDLGGVQKGLERANKIMMPLLLILLLIVTIRSLTLPGASQGLAFLFKPNMDAVHDAGGLGIVALRAMGVCFASLSIGYGVYITFGSYLGKEENMVLSSVMVPIGDTLVAVIAALATIPMVFSAGIEPTSGAGMMFGTLPLAFASLGSSGRVFCILFFLMATFAALTSIVGLYELAVCWMKDSFGIDRKKALLITDVVCIVVALLEVLSFGPLSGVSLFGQSIFDFICTLDDVYLVPAAAMVITIFVGWVWKPEKALVEISNDGALKFRFYKIWRFLIKYAVPIGIAIVFIMSL